MSVQTGDLYAQLSEHLKELRLPAIRLLPTLSTDGATGEPEL